MPPNQAGLTKSDPTDPKSIDGPSNSTRLLAGCVLVGVFVWAYLPTLNNLVYQWGRVADYSHGYLVVPIAIAILWLRRDQFPERVSSSWWLGLGLFMIAAVMRWYAAKYFLEPLVGWTIPIWVAGCVSLLFGWRSGNMNLLTLSNLKISY